ncbi:MULTISPECIES: MerR family transcriptional regulator [Tsukamurella]|nr:MULTISPECIES: MerR family transcriptional regulator [Tsukamurella]NMD57688.1 MerR family transcriptional regulator [Tsukamurella columbiensis]
MNSDTNVIVKPGLRMRDLCARTGATPRMIRHYEATGILAPGRESNGYRVFTEEDVRTVADARCLIEAGLSAAETAELVGIVCGDGDPAPGELDAALIRIAERRTVLDERIAQLIDARAKLDELRDYVHEARGVTR